MKAQGAPGDGSDERRSKVDYVHKEREIDRDNDRYRERVVDEEGVVLHDVEEPLSLHFGHGSAKVRRPNPGTPWDVWLAFRRTLRPTEVLTPA